MLPPDQSLLVLPVVGGVAAAALAPRLERIEPARLAQIPHRRRAFMGVCVLAYVAANVFGAQAVRPLSTGPRDLANLLMGAFYGLAVAHAWRGRLNAFFRQPDVLLAVRLATGAAFVLAGLVNVFLPDMGVDFLVQAGYTKTFRLFIMTAEVLGGVALLLPAAVGLTIDMFRAIYTQVRVGEPLAELAPPLVMLLRLTAGRVGTGGRQAPVDPHRGGRARLYHRDGRGRQTPAAHCGLRAYPREPLTAWPVLREACLPLRGSLREAAR